MVQNKQDSGGVIAIQRIYELLIHEIPQGLSVVNVETGLNWTVVQISNGGFGMAMTTEGTTRPRVIKEGYTGKPLKLVCEAIYSWNLIEAGIGMAAINAYYNSPQRLEMLHAEQPFDNFCTYGIPLSGKTVGMVGHLRMPKHALDDAREVFIIERNPQPGDYPDSACEYLLPKCDLVIITGSALVNRTMPRLMELSKDAEVIWAGPTVPMCSKLFELSNLKRLAGLVVTDQASVLRYVTEGGCGSPYRWGKSFMLEAESYGV